MNAWGQFNKLVTASHELNHARAFHILSTRIDMSTKQFTRAHFSHLSDSIAYAREEIIAEGRVHTAIKSAMLKSGAKIDPNDLDNSNEYIAVHKNVLKYHQDNNRWPLEYLQLYDFL